MKDFSYYKNVKYLSKKEEKNLINVYSKLFEIYTIKNKNLNAIELGSGHGIKTIVLKQLFKTLLAIEPNKILYELLEKKTEKFENVKTLESTCENLNLLKDKFDIAIFTYSFNFMKNKNRCLKNVINSLNKNGYILIIQSNGNYIHDLNIDKKDNKYKKNKIDEIDTLQIISKNKELNLIFFGIFSSNMKDFVYLLQKR